MSDETLLDEIRIGGQTLPPTEVHPLAALFPMLADDDLKSMAEDIKANGLRHPIVIDEAGVLVDGRNRLEACLRAGVEPDYLMIDSADAEAFIWSANAKRRHVTKGQLAMVAAMAFTFAAKVNTEGVGRKRGGQDEGKAAAAKAAGVSTGRLALALSVAKHAPGLADAVMAGSLPLDAAYEQAKAIEKAAAWRDNGLAELRRADPDLADRVRDEEITLEQARKVLEDRDRAEASVRDSVMLGLSSGVTHLLNFEKSEGLRRLPEWRDTDAFKRYFPDGLDLEAAQRGLDAIKEIWATGKE